MIKYGYHVDSDFNPSLFQTKVADSIANGNSYGVLYWRYTGTVFILHPEHLIKQEEDTDYYYELYGVTGMNGDLRETTTAYGSYPWYICIRYSKSTPNTSTSIYAHAMTINDYGNVFANNLQDSRIYSWHGGSDNVPSYYLYGQLPIGAEWGIVDGDLPFLGDAVNYPAMDDVPSTVWLANDEDLPWMECFIQYPPLDDVYAGSWVIGGKDEDCPWLQIFPDIETISDYPICLWRITDEDDCPWKIVFPDIERINDAPLGLWVIRDRDDCPWKKAFPKLYKPIKEIPPKYITPVKAIIIKDIEYNITVYNPLTYNVKVRKGVKI
jgi:hypothetical protein